ncbi:hypothetical protein D1614_02010 [Maribellus luteus]|uniref:Uncharacterized protein n=1 Tax=Maribellus luteus TaxID=2305463 RepID=A0A399T784_9BACT|nr:hypothetical protein D1614_02010 [Maribellus luteus]
MAILILFSIVHFFVILVALLLNSQERSLIITCFPFAEMTVILSNFLFKTKKEACQLASLFFLLSLRTDKTFTAYQLVGYFHDGRDVLV